AVSRSPAEPQDELLDREVPRVGGVRLDGPAELHPKRPADGQANSDPQPQRGARTSTLFEIAQPPTTHPTASRDDGLAQTQTPTSARRLSHEGSRKRLGLSIARQPPIHPLTLRHDGHIVISGPCLAVSAPSPRVGQSRTGRPRMDERESRRGREAATLRIRLVGSLPPDMTAWPSSGAPRDSDGARTLPGAGAKDSDGARTLPGAREAQVDLGRARVGPAGGDDLGTRVELDALRAVHVQ